MNFLPLTRHVRWMLIRSQSSWPKLPSPMVRAFFVLTWLPSIFTCSWKTTRIHGIWDPISTKIVWIVQRKKSNLFRIYLARFSDKTGEKCLKLQINIWDEPSSVEYTRFTHTTRKSHRQWWLLINFIRVFSKRDLRQFLQQQMKNKNPISKVNMKHKTKHTTKPHWGPFSPTTIKKLKVHLLRNRNNVYFSRWILVCFYWDSILDLFTWKMLQNEEEITQKSHHMTRGSNEA